MKNQQTRTARSLKIALFFVALTALVTMLCCFAVPVNADKAQVTVTEANLDLASIGITKDANGVNVMQYVGKDALADLELNMKSKPAGLSPTVSVVVKSVSFAKYNVGPTTMTVEFDMVGDTEGKYMTPHKLVIGVNIVPKELTWSSAVNVSATYDQSSTYYKFDNVTLPELVGVVPGDRVVPTALIEVNADGAGTYQTQASATLSNRNYTVAPLNVTATINKVNIQYIDWANDYTFVFGNNSANLIKVYGYDSTDASGKEYPLTVVYPTGYGSVGTHEISVASPDAKNIQIDGSLQTARQVVITEKKYQVSMGSATFFGSSADDIVKYGLAVQCAELPVEIREKITYTVNGQPFTGTVAVGSYTVVATLPTSNDYSFVDAQGNEVETLSATLTIQNPYVAGGYDGNDYQVIVVSSATNTGDVKVEVAEPELARKALRGFPFHKGYAVTLSGVNAGDKFTVLIPIDDDVRHKYAASVTADDLYIYDAATGKLVKAVDSGYAVSVVDNAYVQIDNYSAAGTVTFVVAPDASIPFFVTPFGIALLIILFLALLVLLFFIGLRLRRFRKEEVLVVVDTEGEVDETADVAASECVEDEEQYLNDSVDAMVEQLNDEVVPEEEPELDVTEATEEAVQEALDELKAEAANEVLDEETTEEAVEEPVDETLTDELAESVAENLEESVEAEDELAEVDESEVQEAVDEALQEALNDSADATDAIEVVEEEAAEEVVEEVEEEAVEVIAPVESDEDDDDNDDDDDDDGDVDTSFFGLNALDLKFIDVKADPEGYAELLERERNGEIRIITRYRRSFQSRMIQSTGNVQDYYNVIKNLLLSYKGVKNRVSWNYEAFNRGRVHVAKVNAKTKTLYLYLALDPEELADTKYGIVDVSSKKKYASVPVLMKIKGERKFKYALELIEKACGEVLELPKVKDFVEADYHMPYMTVDEMVEEGVLKKLCAGVPVEYFNTPEEEVAPSEEKNADVTAVPVTENPAELTPVEEAPAEEAPVEETPAEEVPAAENTDETSTEV